MALAKSKAKGKSKTKADKGTLPSDVLARGPALEWFLMSKENAEEVNARKNSSGYEHLHGADLSTDEPSLFPAVVVNRFDDDVVNLMVFVDGAIPVWAQGCVQSKEGYYEVAKPEPVVIDESEGELSASDASA